MKCFNEEELDTYLDGAEIPGLPEHARHCQRCANLLRQMKRLRLVLSEVDVEAPPQGLADRVMCSLSGAGARSDCARLDCARSDCARLDAKGQMLYVTWVVSSAVAGYILSIMMMQRAWDILSGLMAYTSYAGALLRLIRGISSGGWQALWLILGISQAATIWSAVLLVFSGIILATCGGRRFA